MSKNIFFIQLAIFFILFVVTLQYGCDLPESADNQHVISPLPYTYTNPDDLPKNFFWGNITGNNLLTRARTQVRPRQCGSCWAFATTGALSDRFKIATEAKVPDVHLSP